MSRLYNFRLVAGERYRSGRASMDALPNNPD